MSLAEIHGIGSLVTLAAIATFGVVAAIAAAADRFHVAVGRLRIALLVVIGAQLALGAATWLTGLRPRDGLHILYGLALLAVLPLATSFATDAPPRARDGVLAAAAVVGLLLVWRLTSTG